MPTALAPSFVRFRQVAAYVRSRGWQWPFTLSGNTLRPLGMCSLNDAGRRHDNDNHPDNRWKA